MKLTALVLLAAFSLGGCFEKEEEQPEWMKPENPLPGYKEFRQPRRYDNLARLDLSESVGYQDRNFY